MALVHLGIRADEPSLTLEGFAVEGPVTQTEVEKKGRSGKAGYKVVEGGIASGTSTVVVQGVTYSSAEVGASCDVRRYSPTRPGDKLTKT